MKYTIKDLVAFYKEYTQDKEYVDSGMQDRKYILVAMNYKDCLDYVINCEKKSETYDCSNNLGNSKGALFISSVDTEAGIKYAFGKVKRNSIAIRQYNLFDSEEECVKRLIYQYGKTIGVGEKLYNELLQDEEENIQSFYDEKARESGGRDFIVTGEGYDVTFTFIGNTYFLTYDQYEGIHKLSGPGIKKISVFCPSPTPVIDTGSDYWPPVEEQIKKDIIYNKWEKEYWATHYIGKKVQL